MKKIALVFLLLFFSNLFINAGNCHCWEYGTENAYTYGWTVGQGEGCCTGTAEGLGIWTEYVQSGGGWIQTGENGFIQEGSEYQERCCPPT
jgi:hypothetical protein